MSGSVEPRDLTNEVDNETLLAIRQHALDIAAGEDTGSDERPSVRRQRITADADAWSKFVLAGKIAGS